METITKNAPLPTPPPPHNTHTPSNYLRAAEAENAGRRWRAGTEGALNPTDAGLDFHPPCTLGLTSVKLLFLSAAQLFHL